MPCGHWMRAELSQDCLSTGVVLVPREAHKISDHCHGGPKLQCFKSCLDACSGTSFLQSLCWALLLYFTASILPLWMVRSQTNYNCIVQSLNLGGTCSETIVLNLLLLFDVDRHINCPYEIPKVIGMSCVGRITAQ